MITSKQDLRSILAYEEKLYYKYMFPTRSRLFWGKIKHEPLLKIWEWQKASRKSDYYKFRVDNNPTLIEKILYIYYISKRNRLGEKIGIEAETKNIKRGLFIYHFAGGIVVNGASCIGENFHLHGSNCIGNGGFGKKDCPIIGDNVTLGVGARIIGNVHIANNVKIGAGAVVVKDISEDGCTVVGIPGRIIKQNN